MKWPVVILGVVLVVATASFMVIYEPAGQVSSATTTTELIPGTPSVLYQHSAAGFTILRPADATLVDKGFAEYLATNRQLVGFVLATSSYARTNLQEAGLFVGLSSEHPDVQQCLAPKEQETATGTKLMHGAIFSMFTSASAAAGTTYEKTSYRTIRNGNCYELLTLLRSGSLGNYPEGTVSQFDPLPLRLAFDNILDSFQFTTSASSGVQGSVRVSCKSDVISPDCKPQTRVVEAYQGVSVVGLFKTGLDGAFRAELPPGRYELHVQTASSTRCASVGLIVPVDAFIATDISCRADTL